MNKLSELSKPVGHFVEWQDAETGEKEWCECSKQNGAPLYSQEYVSALLAELEAKDTRIAELSSWLEHNIERAKAAETKLATPVRLPQRYCISLYDDIDWEPDANGDSFKCDEVINILRDQGFSVVEGDEQ